MYRDQRANRAVLGVPLRSLGCGDAHADQYLHIDQRAAVDGRFCQHGGTQETGHDADGDSELDGVLMLSVERRL